MNQAKCLLILFLTLGYDASAASSRLASIASISAKQQQLLGRLGRGGAKLGKSSFLQPKQPHSYRPVRTLTVSSTPNLLNRAQASLTNMTKGLYNTFWRKPTTITPQPISLTNIRAEIHAAHEQDKQGKPILPQNIQEKIKHILITDPIQTQELLQELMQELNNFQEQIDDLKEQEDWYQERGAQKLWQIKLSLLENEFFTLELIKQFIQSQQE